jgi:hypothetical protein
VSPLNFLLAAVTSEIFARRVGSAAAVESDASESQFFRDFALAIQKQYVE